MLKSTVRPNNELTNLLISMAPGSICLDEDFLKTSFVFVFRKRLQDVLIKTNIFAILIRLRKTSSRRRDQDQYIRLGHTSSRHFQDIFKTSSRRLAKMSLKSLEDVLQKRLQEIFKTSYQDVFKTSSRRLAKTSSRHV